MLVTGFEPFPGAPVNPTEWLVSRLATRPPVVPGMGPFHAAVLPVAYGEVAERLSELGRAFEPDIAIHFGLARLCSGFRLERLARNRLIESRPDNSGAAPADGPICAGPEQLPSTLPLAEIHQALGAAGLPTEWSDDAGGYLCNMVFTLSAAHACDGFAPQMAGFVHVPLTAPGGSNAGGASFTQRSLEMGAEIVIRTCVHAFRRTALQSA